jgi:hypothetical protein
MDYRGSMLIGVRRGAILFVGVVAALGSAAPPAGARGARTPAADCQPFAGKPCLLPFPSNLFTRSDRSSRTGLRVQLPVAALPVSNRGDRIDAAPYDRNDGFSPGSTLIVHVRGLDNARALQRTGAVGLLDMSQALDPNQPIVVIDERTGRRQLIWSELDPYATAPQSTDLVIHPGSSFTEGDTYVVALRGLRDARGAPIAAPDWFERLRDGRALLATERSQPGRYARIFDVLKRAGIARSNLYEAWDFTVGSRQSLTSRLLSIRNDAFAQLGDHNLADGIVAGRAPNFTILSAGSLTLGVRAVLGTFQVPCYLIVCGPSATTGFHYSSTSPNALPTQIPGNMATASFECLIPSSAGSPAPARISLYGHGFLGSDRNVESLNNQELASAHNLVLCATDWWGLARGDKPYDIQAMMHLSRFPAMVDRMQQGVLNMLYLGRLMINPHGLASDPAFQRGGRPVIDTSHLFYDGNSTGGIQGGITTAVAPDFRRAVLGVTGVDWANLLIPRTSGIGSLGVIAFCRFPDLSLRPVILDLMQQLWDRGDPDGYAPYMTSHPLADTPSHTVLMQIAYGDKEVPMYAAAVEARTIGAFAYQPALDLATNRIRDRNLLFGVPTIPSYPFAGSAIVVWDAGPGLVRPPPVASIPGLVNAPPPNFDPHEVVSYTPAAQAQISDFLEPNGAVIDVCNDQPCRAIGYQP